MKKTLLLLSLLISFSSFSQSDNIVISGLTEVLMKKYYSNSEIAELNKYSEKLKTIDYLYSKSFEVSEHQKYSQEQFLKIDVNKYNSSRKLDSNALVFDEESGLSIILYSLNKMETDKKLLMPSNKKENAPSSKIAH